MTDGTDVATTGPEKASSWRDVYTLVQGVDERQSAQLAAVEERQSGQLTRVEMRLSGRMDEIAEVAKATGSDHEVRIRVLEQGDYGRTGADRRVASMDTSVRGWIAVGLMLLSGSIGLAGLVIAVSK